MIESKGVHVHFVGIGGIGMSGIAQILVELGYRVSGSDLHATPITQRLEEKGISFFVGHAGANVNGADVLVKSSAISADNPEILEARARGIPILLRAEMLAALMRNRFGIAVAGTHGKTTTTSMLASILELAGKDPTVVVGGERSGLGQNARLGRGRYIVAEADESDASFLKLSPQVAVVTNIDADVNPSAGPFARLQFDYEKTMRQIKEVFLEFLRRVPAAGHAILCWDCPHLRIMRDALSCQVLTYGTDPASDLTAGDISLEGLNSRFSISLRGKSFGTVSLKVPGEHNVLNALGAVGAGLRLGIPFETVKAALEGFQGVRRRFEVIGEVEGITVVDDYAHNPTKIKATLAAAKAGWKRRTVAIFQPHRYTRSKFLKDEFISAFEDADVLFVTPIYTAGEAPIPGVSGEALSLEIRKTNPAKPVHFFETEDETVAKLLEVAQPGDIVITLGAGDVHRIGAQFLAGKKRA